MDFRDRPMPSKAPGGYGTITRKGYRRVGTGHKQRMEHVLVWERHHGPVPPGQQIHHKNGNKLDNSISNLEAVTPLAHKREHSGCTIRDGEWWKPCRKCGTEYPVSDYYRRKDGVSPWCKPCCVRNAVENKRKRKAARDTPPNG